MKAFSLYYSLINKVIVNNIRDLYLARKKCHFNHFWLVKLAMIIFNYLPGSGNLCHLLIIFANSLPTECQS